MKRHFWIPFCILILTLAATVCNNIYIDKTVGRWCNAVEDVRKNAGCGDWDTACAQIKKTEKEWHRHHTYLHITVTHGDIDDVEELISQAVRYAGQEDKRVDNVLTRLNVQLADLRESQTFFIGNLL